MSTDNTPTAAATPLSSLATLTTLLELVKDYAPLVKETSQAAPTVIADCEKIAADVKALKVDASIADLQKIFDDVKTPVSDIIKVVIASKGMILGKGIAAV